MSNIKPSSHGIVVEHKETGIHYAVSDANYNEAIHRKVRDLKPGETVLGFKPKPKEPLGGTTATKTEGSASAASQEKKEGN
ncbi:hypothetical protein HOV00_gp13 [Microbacterium phage Schubert]|uniref:Uncharacterized protein n=1 Tax=Microbacterium phage Schubert TaxID=2500787 RepID=A0A3T0INU3_9CAUD|nr:hypothetical protein HOV00_gp13 [Microbacterium phage Schubert]AZV01720.1 hypothetical protein SEA_SCHUBERT_13 [Microbacterium phage Schubert]